MSLAETIANLNEAMASVDQQGRATAPDRFISITRARLIARYRMHTLPGRPEELETNASPKLVVSLAYSGGEMRIRQHGGNGNREWVDVRDFRLRDGWLSEVYDYLDPFIGYISPRDIKAPRQH
jgi:hypothetical protein